MDRYVTTLDGHRALLTLLTHIDNYSVLLSHFTRQNAVEAADIRAYLGIDEEYEDLDP